MIDVYLYGMISASTVYVLDENFLFPHPNEYAEIKNRYPSVGGEAINSAIMLSKLGLKIKVDGNWLNKNHADKVFDLLKPFDINTSRLISKEKLGTEEVVITDKNSRTVFGNYAAFHNGGKQWNDPNEDDIRNAKYISIDPYFRNESLLAAEMCVRNGKPYVTLDCRHDDFIARNSEAVIISHELRNQAYLNCNMRNVFEEYLAQCEGLIIFTFGADELWYGRKGEQIKKYKPYKIIPVDTAGAGDSFRAGIIFGLFNGWDDDKTIDFASAVSACVCLSIPHTLNAPGLEGVYEFMKQNRKQI